MSNVGSGGGAPAAGSAVPAASSGAADVAEAPKEEVKEEKNEDESDDDMVRTLFDFQCLQVLLIFINIIFTLRRVLDFSINLLYYIRFHWRICSIACPMWSYEGACSRSMPILLTQNKMDLERDCSEYALFTVLNSDKGYLIQRNLMLL